MSETVSRATTLGDYQVLKFDLGAETYCVDIDHVDEIVDANVGELTPLPNQPAHVEGVVDLRGRTTTVVDPRTALGIDREDECRRIVVFESEGVLVSEANEGSGRDRRERPGVLANAVSQGSSDERSESDSEVAVGWLVEEAHQVSDVREEDVDRTVSGEGIRGIVREDTGFVVWVEPETIHG